MILTGTDTVSDDGNNTGAIVGGGVVGGILGAIIFLLLIIILVLYCMKKRGKSNRSSKEHVCTMYMCITSILFTIKQVLDMYVRTYI